MSYFGTARNIELSLLDYIEDTFANTWSDLDIRTVKSFTQAYDLDIPVICLRVVEPLVERLEIGSSILKKQYYITIDIFATSHAERIDIVDFIMDKLAVGCTYYEHTQQIDKSQLSQVATGRIRIATFEENTKLEFGENVDSRDRYRHFMSLIAEK